MTQLKLLDGTTVDTDALLAKLDSAGNTGADLSPGDELCKTAADALRALIFPREGREVVLKLRDEVLQLVTCYNTVGAYRKAMTAQQMAVALHKFEDDITITHMAWPPRVDTDEHGPFIPDMDGKPMDTEET